MLCNTSKSQRMCRCNFGKSSWAWRIQKEMKKKTWDPWETKRQKQDNRLEAFSCLAQMHKSVLRINFAFVSFGIFLNTIYFWSLSYYIPCICLEIVWKSLQPFILHMNIYIVVGSLLVFQYFNTTEVFLLINNLAFYSSWRYQCLNALSALGYLVSRNLQNPACIAVVSFKCMLI